MGRVVANTRIRKMTKHGLALLLPDRTYAVSFHLPYFELVVDNFYFFQIHEGTLGVVETNHAGEIIFMLLHVDFGLVAEVGDIDAIFYIHHFVGDGHPIAEPQRGFIQFHREFKLIQRIGDGRGVGGYRLGVDVGPHSGNRVVHDDPFFGTIRFLLGVVAAGRKSQQGKQNEYSHTLWVVDDREWLERG